MTRDESRRISTYRQLAKVERFEETLRALIAYSRAMGLREFSLGHEHAGILWTGRADGLEDLMERVTNSTKVKAKQVTDDDATQEG